MASLDCYNLDHEGDAREVERDRTGLVQDAETKWDRSDKMKAASEGTHVLRGKRIGLQRITLAGKLHEKK